MRTLTTILLYLMIATNAIAQPEKQQAESKPTFFISLQAGPSFPLGEFSSAALQTYSSPSLLGLPKIGFGGRLSAAYGFTGKTFGLLFSLSHANYSNYSQFEGKYYRYESSGLGSQRSISTYTYTSSNWKLTALQAGAYYQIVQKHNFRFKLWLMAGVLQTRSPEVTYDQTGSIWVLPQTLIGFSEHLLQPTYTSYKPALSTGFALNMPLSNHWAATLMSDFTVSEAIFEGEIQVQHIEEGQENEYPIAFKDEFKVYLLQGAVGVTYTF